MASIVRYGETPETSFNQWAWNLILRLKLHKNDYGIQQNYPTVPFSSAVPDMTEAPTFHPLLKAVKVGMPIGCYLALAMTTVGHRYCVWAETQGLLSLIGSDSRISSLTSQGLRPPSKLLSRGNAAQIHMIHLYWKVILLHYEES